MPGAESQEAPAGAAFAAFLCRRWRFIVAQSLALVVVVLVVLALTSRPSYDFTAHFVLHPDPSADPADVANNVSVLRQDGPLVQTVLKVLGSEEIVQRAATAARIDDPSKYAISATVSPGSSFFDARVSGASREATDTLGKSVEIVASRYVEKGYRGFKFDVLGSDRAKHDPFPPSPSLLVLVFLLGAAAAAAELFVIFEIAQLRPVLRRAITETTADRAPVAPVAAPVVAEVVAEVVAVVPMAAEPIVAEPSSKPPVPRAKSAGANGKRAKKAPPPAGSTSKAVRNSTARSKADSAVTVSVDSHPATSPDPALELRRSAGS